MPLAAGPYVVPRALPVHGPANPEIDSMVEIVDDRLNADDPSST